MYYFWASSLIETSSFIFLIYLENAKKRNSDNYSDKKG